MLETNTDPPDKANCTTGCAELHGYQGLPKGSVRPGYDGNSPALRRHPAGDGASAHGYIWI